MIARPTRFLRRDRQPCDLERYGDVFGAVRALATPRPFQESLRGRALLGRWPGRIIIDGKPELESV